MFFGQETQLDVALGVARVRLSRLVQDGGLARASQDAFGEGSSGLIRVGPVGAAPGLSRLVRIQFGDLVDHGDSVRLALRWEAAGQGGGLTPALDADITLTAAGEQVTRLKMDGSYRPPLGALGAQLDRVALHRVATATIESFVHRVATAIVNPASALPGKREGWEWEPRGIVPEAGDP
jgi:hypothetical protein